MSHVAYLSEEGGKGENISGQEHSKCKGPEAGVYLGCWRNTEEASQAGTQKAGGAGMGKEDEISRATALMAL